MSFEDLDDLDELTVAFLNSPDFTMVYQRISERFWEAEMFELFASATIMSEASPYLRSLIEANAYKRLPSNSIYIVGADFKTCQNILEYIHLRTEFPDTRLKVNNPELLGYCQLHEAAELLQIDSLIKLAMQKIDIILAKPLHPANVYALLKKYERNGFATSLYVEMMEDNLACSLFKWYGEAYKEAKLMRYLQREYFWVWASVKRIVRCILRDQQVARDQIKKEAEVEKQHSQVGGQVQVAGAQEGSEQMERPPAPDQLAAPVSQTLPVERQTWAAVAARVHSAAQAPAESTGRPCSAIATAAATRFR